MKRFTKAIAAILLMTTLFYAVGCGKDDDPNNGNGGSNPTEEGIYLGVIGFNYNLVTKDLDLLNSSTKSDYTTFISNLTMDNLTGLYYADYTALKKLQSYGEPPKLTNVALVTFTDGLDNASLDDDKNPENYPTREAYLNALNNKIKTEKVHGLNINAYTIGLKGNDVQDEAAFQNNLKKLASSDDNVFEVTSMDEAIQRFAEIAESLHSTSTSTSLSLLVPPGYDDGLVLRFTFDQVGSATNSTLYLECTYKRSDNGRRLENITYYGFKQGVTSLSSVEKLSDGFYKFVFENLEKSAGGFITQSDKEHLKLYRQISSGWEPETEFDNNSLSTVTEERSSALIMLVLDCTTSLGSQFSSLKTGAVNFVETLVSSNGGGNALPTVSGCSVTDITLNSAFCCCSFMEENGITDYGVCWSTSHNPTISDNVYYADWGFDPNFCCTITNLNANTTYYVRAFAIYSAGINYGEERSFATLGAGNIGGGTGTYNGHDYVDLGLPSGTLWATCNVGANQPEVSGNYFAWGETTIKVQFGWDTYKYSNGDWCQLTKYCNNSIYGYNGFVDNITMLESIDDAAAVGFGAGWRIPTKDEWKELCQNTTHSWITLNGVNGYLFVASNGNNLFLPASGWITDGGLESVGSYGYYWSNSIMGEPYIANRLIIGEYDYNYNGGSYRCTGQSVRAVRSAR